MSLETQLLFFFIHQFPNFSFFPILAEKGVVIKRFRSMAQYPQPPAANRENGPGKARLRNIIQENKYRDKEQVDGKVDVKTF